MATGRTSAARKLQREGPMMMHALLRTTVLLSAVLLWPVTAMAQQSNVPEAAQEVERAVERVVDRFGIGVSAGVAFDPELIDFGVHATFAPIFIPDVEFRPGVELGLGELTTLLGINLDVLYVLPGTTATTRWLPYVGGGPNFVLSRRSFEEDRGDNFNRFDFSDTNFRGGFNFIAGARRANGAFLELRATAWGVSSVRLLAGFNF